MKTYLDANNFIGKTDSESIQSAIAEAVRSDVRRVIIPRNNRRTGEDKWTIDKTILLPDNIEILIDDAHLVLADGVFANMFANENARTEACRHLSGRQQNITLRGRGNAVLDGGNYNGLCEGNSEKDGYPHITYNNTLLFCNVNGLTVENMAIVRQRYFGIVNYFVSDAVFRNIRFASDFTRVDSDGVHHPDELPENYGEIYIKNSDGIDILVGCNHILVENISGFTEDDSVALTAIGETYKRLGFDVEGADKDIHDVVIKNVSTVSSYCSNIRLLNDDGHKLYNVTIDGVTSLCPDDRYRNGFTVRIGDIGYCDKHSTLGDTHHITVKNVISEAYYGVAICKGLCDSTIENITVIKKDGVGFGVTPGTYETGAITEVKNVKVRNIHLTGEDNQQALNIENLHGELTVED